MRCLLQVVLVTNHTPPPTAGCKACPHPVTGPAVTGSPDVIINGKPALRVGDNGVHSTCCGANTWQTVAGSATVFINGRPAVRLGDATQHCGGAGKTIEGSPDVLIGDDNGAGAGSTVAPLITPTYDEQIKFVNAHGAKLTNVAYTLTLANGSTVRGVTDADGRTQRIITDTPSAITEAQLQPKKLVSCCTQHAETAQEDTFLTFPVASVQTNPQAVGSSVIEVKTPEDAARGVTTGEIAIAWLIFQDSIDYAQVKIHNGEYLWFGMQPDNEAMAPDGGMYFNPKGTAINPV